MGMTLLHEINLSPSRDSLIADRQNLDDTATSSPETGLGCEWFIPMDIQREANDSLTIRTYVHCRSEPLAQSNGNPDVTVDRESGYNSPLF